MNLKLGGRGALIEIVDGNESPFSQRISNWLGGGALIEIMDGNEMQFLGTIHK